MSSQSASITNPDAVSITLAFGAVTSANAPDALYCITTDLQMASDVLPNCAMRHGTSPVLYAAPRETSVHDVVADS